MGVTGDEVRQARKVLGLTQRELAERLAVSMMTISRWELGVIRVNETAARLLKVLTMGAPEGQTGARPRRRRG